VGILTKNACGDVTRNVVTCPLAGVCPYEEGDTFKMLHAIADHPELLDEQRNLSRKHKISVAGCGRACAQTLMNCQGWYPVNKNGTVGWKFHAGGGLGSKPYLAKAIFEWVPEALVVDVARASTEVYRRLGNRRVRALARLKIVVDNLGAQGYAEKVLEVLKERKVPGIEKIIVGDHAVNVGDSFLAGQSVIEQKTKGLFVVRAIIKRSELSGEEARRFAKWAEQYGDGTLVFTNRQNLLFRSVSEAKTGELVSVLRQAGYITEGFEHVPDVVACVGTTVCNLAVADTPNTYKRMMKELTQDEPWWRSIGPVRINMNGCPNSCAQHAISDIGLRGLRKRTERGSEEGYTLFIGGSLAGAGHVAEPVCDVTAPYVVPLLKKMLDIYLRERRSSQETFGVFARRITGAGMKGLLGEIQIDTDPVNERNQSYDAFFKDSINSSRKKDSQ
jgi:sulfite reductase beta subunit-like hemoprotein